MPKEYDHYRIIDTRSGGSAGTFKYERGVEVPYEVLYRELERARDKKNAPVDVLVVEKYRPWKRGRC